MQKKKQWYHRWAPSLGGGFAGTPEKVWGTKPYDPKKHLNEPTVFCGCYGIKDFMAVHNHKGRRLIWWAGSDCRHLINGYWLDDVGKIRLDPKPLAKWLNKYVENWVENKVEHDALKKLGINSKIAPSFLGDVNKFKPQKLSEEVRYYSSVSGNDFKLYGWDKIVAFARKMPKWKFYLYGNTVPFKVPKNVIVRGRMSQKEMDKEIMSMTGAIRMVEAEGFSEIVAKSVLWGQKPISKIPYPFLSAKDPRKELLKIVNKYPWAK